MNKSDKIFLLNPDVTALLHDIQNTPIKQTIFFTKIKLCKEVRYTKQRKHYIKSIKTGVGYAQRKSKQTISKKAYKNAQKNHLANILYINRYDIVINNYKLYLYEYKKSLSGLYLLHLPYKLSHICNDLLSSGLWASYVEKEVTHDPRFENKNLALFGNPSKQTYNIYAIFKDLENQRISKLDRILFHEMKSSDAVRIKLYILYVSLSQYKKIEHNNSKDFQAFRTKLKNTKLILSEYDNIFEHEIFQKIYQHFIKILKITKTRKNLLLIKEKLQKLNHDLQSNYINKLIENIQYKITLEDQKIRKYFDTREFSIIEEQYKLFLRENNKSFTTYDAQVSIAYSSRLRLNTIHKKLIKLSQKLDGCNDEKSYDKLEQEFKKFITFAQTFAEVLSYDKLNILLNISQKILLLIKKHQKINKALLIFSMIQKHVQDLTLQQKEALDNKTKECKLERKKLDQKISESINSFRQIDVERVII